MAFENVSVQSTRNGSNLIVGFREDLAIGDVVVLSLTSMLGISSVQWILKGRPEGSSVGGAGPEPITLATAASCSFTVDADDGVYHKDGSYVFDVVINPGSPGETRKTAEVARLSGLTIIGPSGQPLPLRKMGGFESMEDTEKANIAQGWKTQAIRWLEFVRQGGGGGGGGVASVGAGTGISVTGTLTNPIVNNTGVLSVTGGAGISITGTAQNPVVVNTGILSITAGTNISIGGTAQNPIINAAGGGGGGAAATLFRRPNIAGMAGIDTSVFLTSDAHVCEVLTVGDCYKFVPGGTATVDGITVVTATGGGTGQWHRMGIPNQTFCQAKFWSVGPGGSDEAQGWGVDHTASDAVKLATMKELNRRLVGYDGTAPGWYAGSPLPGPSIHLTGSIDTASFAVLSNMKFATGNGYPRIFGDLTLVDGGAAGHAITSYQAAGNGTGGTPNAERTMTSTGLGLVPQYVEKAAVNANGTKFAWVTRQPATNKLALSQVRSVSAAGDWINFPVVGFNDFTTSDVISFYDVVTLPDWPFPEDVPNAVLARVRIGNTDNNYFVHGDMGNAELWLMQVIFGNHARQDCYEFYGGVADTGGQGFIMQPLFVGSHNTIHNANWFMNSAAAVNTVASPFLDNCVFGFAGELNITTAGVWPGFAGPGKSTLNFPEQNSTQVALFDMSYQYGAFQLAPTSHHGGSGIDFYMDDDVKIYGAVPGAMFSFGPGTRSRLVAANITATCPGSTIPGGAISGQIFINAGGTTALDSRILVCNISDVPIFDLQSGSSVAGY